MDMIDGDNECIASDFIDIENYYRTRNSQFLEFGFRRDTEEILKSGKPSNVRQKLIELLGYVILPPSVDEKLTAAGRRKTFSIQLKLIWSTHI